MSITYDAGWRATRSLATVFRTVRRSGHWEIYTDGVQQQLFNFAWVAAIGGHLLTFPVALQPVCSVAMEKWGFRFGKLVPKVKPRDQIKTWRIVTGDIVCKWRVGYYMHMLNIMITTVGPSNGWSLGWEQRAGYRGASQGE